MSIESWRKEFYPVSAQTAVRRRYPKIKLIEHSLKKWEGLYKKNLAKHDCCYRAGYVRPYSVDSGLEWNPKSVSITAESCSLCEKYYKADEANSCRTCPLYETVGDKACNNSRPLSDYGHFQDTGDPRRMINSLRKALKRENGKV